MSPYPAKVDRDELIQTAWEMVEEAGGDTVSMSTLAQAFGVQAPSLYKHIKNKDELLRAVNALTEKRLFAALYAAHQQAAAQGTAPVDALHAIALAYREFALAHPAVYTLAFTTIAAEARPDPLAQEQSVLPLQTLMAEVSGDDDSLTALRGLLALIHGFVMLEMHQQLRRGGDLGVAYDRCVHVYLGGWL